MGRKVRETQGEETVTIDRFRPEDAEGVSRLFLDVYGKDYPIRVYVEPTLLREANASGEVISSVARTPSGEIVGHSALFRSAPYKGVFESGAGVVHERYRGGKGIFTRMVAHGETLAKQIPAVEVTFGEPVCAHVFSQKMSYRLGWRTMAVEADLMPGALFKGDVSPDERVGATLDFKTIRPKPLQVYVPPVYADILKFIYGEWDDSRTLVPSEGEPPLSHETRIDRKYFTFAQVVRLAIWKMGRDFGEAIERAEEESKSQGVKVIQAWINTGVPWCGWAVNILRRRGYFLGGVLPRWFDHDGILMTWTVQRPSWEALRLQFDRAKKIAAWVREDWRRIGEGK